MLALMDEGFESIWDLLVYMCCGCVVFVFVLNVYCYLFLCVSAYVLSIVCEIDCNWE